VTGAAPSVSGETAPAGGTPPPEPPYDALKRLFDRTIRAGHARRAHTRVHAAGTFCAECRRFIDDDAQAQAAYCAAWHELFDAAPPPGARRAGT